MEWLTHVDLATWVAHIGYVGVFVIIFLEMGVFFGFFLPGDSLILTCGILAAKGFFHIEYIIPVLFSAAVLGYIFGYWFGDKLGHWLVRQKDSWWFKHQHLQKAHDFYAKHGGKALIIGRLVPVVRTFVPITAGMGKMQYRRFLKFNLVGAFVWSVGITLLGYFLGALVPNISKIFLPLMLLVIFLSILPGIIEYWKGRQKK